MGIRELIEDIWYSKFMSYFIASSIVIGSVVGCLALVGRSYNTVMNNRKIDSSAYKTVSYVKGMTGHLEYTKFFDGSQDVKIYPGLGHNLWDSEFHQDLNGDGLVDRVRRHGAEWKMHRLTELLVREYDYDKNKDRFDEADKQLQELMKKYGVPRN